MDDDDDLLDMSEAKASRRPLLQRQLSDMERVAVHPASPAPFLERSKSVPPLGDNRQNDLPINASGDFSLSVDSKNHKSLPNLAKRRRPPTNLLYYKRSHSHSHDVHASSAGVYRTLGGPTDRRYMQLDYQSANQRAERTFPKHDYSDLEDDSESSDESVASKPGFFSSLTRRQALVLLCLSLGDFSSYVCLSLLAPFFPLEASDRGISTTMSGWIFGIFALVQVVSSPIAGKLLNHTGARFMYLAGVFFAGGCSAIFGLLEWIEDINTFLVLCFVVRTFLALGCTGLSTAAFALCALEFDDNVTTVFGILETVIGIGMMVGPALGGVLYQTGGFSLPFYVTGGFMMALVPVTFFALPTAEVDEGEDDSEVKPSLLFKSAACYVILFDVVVSSVLWAVLDPLLEPHLEQFGLSTDVVGLLFLLMSGVYAIMSPIWGWVADHVLDSKPLLVLGFVFSGVAMFLLGPSPLIGLDGVNELWLNIVALVVLGVAISLASVPTFDAIICIAEDVGLPDNLGTYALIAGVWSSAYSLGDFIGPSFGGMIQDAVGFPWTTSIVGLLSMFAALVTLAMWLYEKYGPSSKTRALSVASQDTDVQSTRFVDSLSSDVGIRPLDETLGNPDFFATF